MVVEHGGLADRSCILELQDGLLLYTEDDDIFTADTDGAGTFAHSFESIFDLEAAKLAGKGRQGRSSTEIDFAHVVQGGAMATYRCPTGEKTVSARSYDMVCECSRGYTDV